MGREVLSLREVKGIRAAHRGWVNTAGKHGQQQEQTGEAADRRARSATPLEYCHATPAMVLGQRACGFHIVHAGNTVNNDLGSWLRQDWLPTV